MLHAAKLGSSPMLRELGNVLKMPLTSGVVKEGPVPFHMVAGKVHHRDLEVIFPEFTVKSSGRRTRRHARDRSGNAGFRRILPPLPS